MAGKLKCAFGNCDEEHDLWIKPFADSDVIPICEGCAKAESEAYHLSFQDSRPPKEVDNYIVAYDPDVALAEQLIDIVDDLDEILSQYEGNDQERIEEITTTREQLKKIISKLGT